MEAQESSYSLEKWENIGLLEGLTEEQKVKTVAAFNIALKYIMENEDKYESHSFSTIPFPIIYKIIKSRDLNEKEIIEIINESVVQFNLFADTSELSYYYNLDMEALFISKYAEQKIEELNTRDGQISLKQLREIKEATISKWESMGLLEGLVAYDDSNFAKMYECCPNARINIE